MTPFKQTIKSNALNLERRPLKTLQINLGKLCNQTCLHCHVDAGPSRKEIMTLATVDRILELVRQTPQIQTVDLTGGAPEMNPHFRHLVAELRAQGVTVIDRCNLTVLLEPGYADLADFLAAQNVEVVSSLPCYASQNVDQQRGKGVFDKSIMALQKLNDLGYGRAGSGLILNLVYNPVGANLPPAQAQLEADYKRELKRHFDIEFNQLFTITNVPINRFKKQIQKEGGYDSYLCLLLSHFNPQAAEGVMCRDLISISWDGWIYDCDFNQMLDMPVAHQKTSLWDIKDFTPFNQGQIAFDDHCYACTAGAGSSCGGSLV